MLMKKYLTSILSLTIASAAFSQTMTSNIPYLEDGHERHVLDVYQPEKASDELLPVVFWIHGGGWTQGDKSDVELKPKVLIERGYVFVSTNYRLLPDVDMDTLIADVAAAMGWVHKNIREHGGDPHQIIVGGHSAGAQLAALLCIDERYLAKHDVFFSDLKGCIPVDGDTYDLPKIIATAEFRAQLYGRPLPSFGHRQKFGNDPKKHVDFSAVTHVAEGKDIPPFLILYFPGNPATRSQAGALTNALKKSNIPVTMYGKSDSNHVRLNDDLGKLDDPATEKLWEFLDSLDGE